MILIADAHVSISKGNAAPFFQMLAAFEDNDQDLVFLGDIFELWIALPDYEEEIHRRFATWCNIQKKHRTIGFVEGNHEFFLAEERGADFSWCSNRPDWRDGEGNLFSHGDLVNHNDVSYIRFKKLVKNPITKTILRYLPGGPRIAKRIKEKLKNTNQKYRIGFPEDEIRAYAEERFAHNAKRIFLGHFHCSYRYAVSGTKNLYILPDWCGSQKVALYRRNTDQVSFVKWRQLNAFLNRAS